MDKPKFIKFMQKIKDGYGNRFQDLSDGVLKVWYECLGNLDEEKLNASLVNHMRKSEYPPAVADLQKEYDLLMADERKKELEVKRLYDWTVALYPNAHHEDGLHEVYMAILSGYPLDEQIQLAQQILNKTAAYVESVEVSQSESIIPLAEYLKGKEWKGE